MPVTRTCEHCGATYSTPPSHRLRFCSNACYQMHKVGANHPRWRGGRLHTMDGYVYIHQPHHPQATKLGYVLEHRLAMERKLGRYLQPGEAVHHKSGDRQDNRLRNLELCESNGKHSSAHHSARDRYGRFGSGDAPPSVPGAKLTAQDVRRIRRARALGEDRDVVARRFGIGALAVYRIEVRKTWRHVD